MKTLIIFFIITIASAFISVDSSVSVNDIDRKIDSFRVQTKINQELFRIKINKISKPKT